MIYRPVVYTTLRTVQQIAAIDLTKRSLSIANQINCAADCAKVGLVASHDKFRDAVGK